MTDDLRQPEPGGRPRVRDRDVVLAAALVVAGVLIVAWLTGLVPVLDSAIGLAPVVIGAATNFFVAYAFIGAAQVMVGEYEAQKALRLISRHKVTEAFAVPTQMYQMAEAKRQLGDVDISSLRLLRTGGSPLPRRQPQVQHDDGYRDDH